MMFFSSRKIIALLKGRQEHRAYFYVVKKIKKMEIGA
jgi:hypothetical protein